MEINGEYIDDRYSIIQPFFEWADKLIEVNKHLFELTGDRESFGEMKALEGSKVNLLRIVQQAERDADENMAAASEARE